MGKSEKNDSVETKQNTPTVMEWTYIWIAGDGTIRSSRFNSRGETPTIQRFDGSATKQASTDNSDLFLVPVKTWVEHTYMAFDMNVGSGIVLCEVQTADGTPHASNTRADLRKFLDKNTKLSTAKIGFEQDILLIDPETRQPYAWPKGKNEKGEETVMFPGPQGRYYGGSGDFMRGRSLFDSFTERVFYRGPLVKQYHPGVCLSQWSYTLEETDLLTACDNLILSRYLLESSAEDVSTPRCVISYQPKSFPGTDWNGSGCNFRVYLENYTKSGGNASLAKNICETIGEDHREHMAAYGAGNEQRLVGKAGGISDYNKFSWGFGDRTASVCVPTVPLNGNTSDFTFIEDRRPGANVDPYAGVLALSRSLVKAVDLVPPVKAEAFEPKLVK